MNTVNLKTTFGTVSFCFYSDTICTANLWQEPKLVVNGVTVEGLLQFQRISATWEWQRAESNLDRADNGSAVSEAIRHKLTKTLTALLNDWYRQHPDEFKAVKADLIQKQITEEEAELARLLDRIVKQQALLDGLRRQLAAVS